MELENYIKEFEAFHKALLRMASSALRQNIGIEGLPDDELSKLVDSEEKDRSGFYNDYLELVRAKASFMIAQADLLVRYSWDRVDGRYSELLREQTRRELKALNIFGDGE